MNTFYYISLITFTLYIMGVVATKGVPKSVSDSYYMMDGLWSSLFTWFCWIASSSLLPYWIGYSQIDSNILPFIACGGLLFVGAATQFRTHEKLIHFSSAIVCFVSSYIWIALYGDVFILVLSLIALMALFFAKNRLFWWEITAFVTIYISLI